MKELTVISGKGGTGKTSLLASFAVLAGQTVICDCDVDAANLHLLLKPVVRETIEFYGGQKAKILPDLCTNCGFCASFCKFGAIQDGVINQYHCEGCALCYHVCPSGAVQMQDHLSGHWFISDTDWGKLVHARLGIAEGNSGMLVNIVRKKARELAKEMKQDLIISDGPPGVGCPVISALAGTDVALVVSEPTVSGLHDLERIVKVAATFNCRTAVCINKYDLDEANSRSIEDMAGQLGVPVIGRIPYDPVVAESVLKGVPVVLSDRGEARSAIEDIWQQVGRLLGG